MAGYRYAFWLLLLIFLIGCRGEWQAQGNSSEKNVRLTYWCAPNPDEINLASELVREFNRAYPNIQVVLQPIPASVSSEEVLLAAIAGKTTPDICSNMWPGAMDEFISSAGLVALDRFADFSDRLTARVPADLLESFRAADGHFYQIPWKTNPIMMMYNCRMLREAGVKQVPRTYSEYLAAAKLVTRDTDGDGRIDQWMGFRDIRPVWWQRLFDFYPFYIAASGGKTLFEGATPIFGNQAAIQVLGFFQALYRQGYYPMTTFQGDNFLSEHLATQFVGPWSVVYVEKFKKPALEYDIAPVPVPDDYQGPIYTYGDFKNISIFSTTKHPAEAWQFCQFMISRQADLRLLEVCSQIPIRQNLLTDPLYMPYFRRNPRLVKFAEQAPYTRGVDGIADLKEIFDALSQEYEACVVYGRLTPTQAIANAVERINVILTWNRYR